MHSPHADATIRLTRVTFNAIILEKTTFEKEMAAGNIEIKGDGSKLGELMGLLDTFEETFDIVTP
jgi:alkyl sulfatase BDS1-like metallo-beta-lactamase superfamily hydrolase